MTNPVTELDQLTAGASALDLALSAELGEKLLVYLDLLYHWNRSAGLTRIDRGDAVRLHLVDSLCALEAVQDAVVLADLGTGGGLPGLPLALARPDLEVCLVETKRRKCSFLRDAVRTLELKNCEVLELDARSLIAGDSDTTIARAFLQPQEMLDLGTETAGRSAVLMVGPGVDPADLIVPESWSLAYDRHFQLPGGPERHRILRYDKLPVA